MKARNGRLDSPVHHRPLRRSPGGDDVIDFDAALHLMEKQLRLSEYRLALLLSQLERLNADMAEAAQGLEDTS